MNWMQISNLLFTIYIKMPILHQKELKQKTNVLNERSTSPYSIGTN